MAITKNTAKAAPAKTEEKKAVAKPAAKAAPAKVAAKPAPEKEVKKAVAAPAAEVEKEPVATIGRKDIAAAIREKVMASGAGISPKVAEVAAVAYEEVVQEALAEGKKISLPGFGTFSVGFREAREATNPQDPTGAKINVPATNVPKFKAGSKLKAAVNGGAEVVEGDEAAAS